MALLRAIMCELFHRKHHKPVQRFLPGNQVVEAMRCDKCGRFVELHRAVVGLRR